MGVLKTNSSHTLKPVLQNWFLFFLFFLASRLFAVFAKLELNCIHCVSLTSANQKHLKILFGYHANVLYSLEALSTVTTQKILKE